MQSNNVVMFPKPYNGPNVEVLSMEEINQNTDMMKHFHIYLRKKSKNQSTILQFQDMRLIEKS